MVEHADFDSNLNRVMQPEDAFIGSYSRNLHLLRPKQAIARNTRIARDSLWTTIGFYSIG